MTVGVDERLKAPSKLVLADLMIALERWTVKTVLVCFDRLVHSFDLTIRRAKNPPDP